LQPFRACPWAVKNGTIAGSSCGEDIPRLKKPGLEAYNSGIPCRKTNEFWGDVVSCMSHGGIFPIYPGQSAAADFYFLN
jgi:hypothetical protein